MLPRFSCNSSGGHRQRNRWGADATLQSRGGLATPQPPPPVRANLVRVRAKQLVRLPCNKATSTCGMEYRTTRWMPRRANCTLHKRQKKGPPQLVPCLSIRLFCLLDKLRIEPWKRTMYIYDDSRKFSFGLIRSIHAAIDVGVLSCLTCIDMILRLRLSAARRHHKTTSAVEDEGRHGVWKRSNWPMSKNVRKMNTGNSAAAAAVNTDTKSSFQTKSWDTESATPAQASSMRSFGFEVSVESPPDSRRNNPPWCFTRRTISDQES